MCVVCVGVWQRVVLDEAARRASTSTSANHLRVAVSYIKLMLPSASLRALSSMLADFLFQFNASLNQKEIGGRVRRRHVDFVSDTQTHHLFVSFVES